MMAEYFQPSINHINFRASTKLMLAAKVKFIRSRFYRNFLAQNIDSRSHLQVPYRLGNWQNIHGVKIATFSVVPIIIITHLENSSQGRT